MKPTKQRLIAFTTGAALMALLLGFAGGVIFDSQIWTKKSPKLAVPAGAKAEFALITEVWQTIEQKYVNQAEVKPRRMAYGAVRGMVKTLSDAGHTRFLTPEMAQQHQNQLQGQFQGIGAYVKTRNGQMVIAAPIDDTPAQRAGLKSGDIILKVNGKDITQLSMTEVINRITGPAGTMVSLTIQNPETGNIRQVILKREEINLDLVSWQPLPGTQVAYVRISMFSEGAAAELKRSLQEIQSENMKGIILDLRDNPGGLLDQAVSVASYFVENGEVLTRKSTQGEVSTEKVNPGIDAASIPMVALANQGTASAAEIVIGALQDHKRATVVGTTTSGAGTVLHSFKLPGGSVLLLAVEEWLTPDGRSIWQKGLTPDLKVKLAPKSDPLRRWELEELSPKEFENSADRQLLQALDVLQTSFTP